VDAVIRKTGRNDSDFRPRIEEAINNAMSSWARILPWPALELPGEVTHVGGKYLYLPGVVNKVVWIMDKTNKNMIRPSDNSWDRDYPTALSEDTQSYAVEFEDTGIWPTMTAFSGPLAAYSTDASDTLGLYIEGSVVPGGSSFSLAPDFNKYRQIEEITIAGQSPVTSSNVFTELFTVGKTADCDGAIILQCGGATVGIISPLENQSTYRRIQLMYQPAAGTVFKYLGYTDPSKLINANQVVPNAVNPEYLAWEAASEILWQLRESERSQLCHREAGKIAEQEIKREQMFGAQGGRVTPEDYE
jgi:hypothetical protein